MANYISVECPHCGKEAARLRFVESAAEDMKAPKEGSEAPPDEVLSKPVREVVLSWPFRTPELQQRLQTRTLNILRDAHILTIGELSSKSEREMLRFKNCGPATRNLLREILQSMNLSFGNGRGDDA